MLNDVNIYVECCKTINPIIYSSEIQNKLLANNPGGWGGGGLPYETDRDARRLA